MGRGRREVRDAGGAYAVAVGDGGQPLHVATEQSGEHLGLGLAELGELGRDVGHRAVVLAELLGCAGPVVGTRVQQQGAASA